MDSYLSNTNIASQESLNTNSKSNSIQSSTRFAISEEQKDSEKKEMAQDPATPNFPRDSGIQHSDDDWVSNVTPPLVTAWRTSSGKRKKRESKNRDQLNDVAEGRENATSSYLGPTSHLELEGDDDDEKRVSIAPSLNDRSSMHYSPIIEKATQVAFTSGPITESDSSSSNHHDDHEFETPATQQGQRSPMKSVSIERLRESTQKLEALLSDIRLLRRSTSNRHGTQSYAQAKPRRIASAAHTITSTSSSTDDYSYSSFDQDSAHLLRKKPSSLHQTPPPSRSSPNDPAIVVQPSPATDAYPPPTPPLSEAVFITDQTQHGDNGDRQERRREGHSLDNITAWTKDSSPSPASSQLLVSKSSRGIYSPASFLEQTHVPRTHTRSYSLPVRVRPLTHVGESNSPLSPLKSPMSKSGANLGRRVVSVAHVDSRTPVPQPTTSTHRRLSSDSSSEEDIDGLMNSLEDYRARLGEVNRPSHPPLQLQSPLHSPAVIQQSEFSPAFTTAPNSPLKTTPLGMPPSRPPPPKPPTLPMLSYSWQKQPTLKEEMDELLELTPPKRKTTSNSSSVNGSGKRDSQDSSADSYRTAREELREPHSALSRDVTSIEEESDEQASSSNEQSQRSTDVYTGTVGNSAATLENMDRHNSISGEIVDTEEETSPLNIKLSRRTSSNSTFPRNSLRSNTSSNNSPILGSTTLMRSVSSSRPLPEIPGEYQFGRHGSTASSSASTAKPLPRSMQMNPLPVVSESAPEEDEQRRRRTSARVSSDSRFDDADDYVEATREEKPRRRKHEKRGSNGEVKRSSHSSRHKSKSSKPRSYLPPQDEKERRTKKESRHRKVRSYTTKQPFSEATIEQLYEMASATLKLDDVDIPEDERVLIEKFVNAVSKLSIEINIDERKKLEGKRRLNNALRAIEGWF
ncbi:hypothetical protein TRVA0_010S01376 [Trichomonascus vanleenenianus]